MPYTRGFRSAPEPGSVTGPKGVCSVVWPPGFVRHGIKVGRILISARNSKLYGLVFTGTHHYMASGGYIARLRELQLVIRTGKSKVRLQSILSLDGRRMIGTWYDSHGHDSGIVLAHLKPGAR